MMQRVRLRLANLLLVLLSVAFALLAMELLLRFFYPFSTFGAGGELTWFRQGPQRNSELFVPDDVLGFRPVVGNDIYSADGIIEHGSIFGKSLQPSKMLVIGDSVTARGRMIRALADRIASDDVSYLNGGVESYNIQQEVEFFFRYQARTNPDRIIHIFHVNDLQSTPLAYRGADGRLQVYSIDIRREIFSPWLFSHSHLYRLASAAAFPRTDQAKLLAEAHASVSRLQAYARARQIAYDIVVFPILQPEAIWTPYDRASHRLLVDLAGELAINAVDLLPLSEAMIARGTDAREMPGDNWHPNDRFAALAADLIVARLPSLNVLVRNPHEH